MTEKDNNITERDFLIRKLRLLPKMIKGTVATLEFMNLLLEYIADRDAEALNYYLDNYPIITADQKAILKKWMDLCSTTIEEFEKINKETINNQHNGRY